MASTIYQGSKLRLKVGGKTIYHATECSFSTNLTLEQIATKDTDGKVSTAGGYDWSVTSNGLIANKPEGSATTQDAKSILELYQAKEPVTIEFTTGEVGDIIISGEAYIASVEMGAPVEGQTSFNCSFTGDGNFTVAAVPAP